MAEESPVLLPPAEESIEAKTDTAFEAKPESGEPTPEPDSEPGFVCDCKQWMRSACEGLPFYKEHKSQRYCVLHYPGKDKSADFKAALDRKQDLNFGGVWFPDEVNFHRLEFSTASSFRSATFGADAIFSSAAFSADADFDSATFSGGAYFGSATFSADADFSGATFNAVASFTGATFSSDADFSGATFNAGAYFSGVTFSADADFSSATFSAQADFSFVKFSADASFSRATFTAHASFTKAIFSADASFNDATFSADSDFISTTFSDDALFLVATFSKNAFFLSAKFGKNAFFRSAWFGANAVFLLATFSADADFSQALFHGRGDFGGASFQDSLSFFGSATEKLLTDEATLGARALGKDPALDFQQAKIEKPERVAFHTLALRPHWFVNVDSRKFVFTNASWEWNTISIEKEVEALTKREEYSHPQLSTAWSLLSITCRQLADNAEANNRYEEASRFRYLAMDLARRTKWKRWSFWKTDWLHMLYCAVSGYGERILRALGVLAAVWFVFVLLYTRVGFAQQPPKASNEGASSMTAPSMTIEDRKGQPLGFSRALTYSLGVLSLQKPDPRPLTNWAHALVTLETILGPVQAALLALAIRRKFMR